MALVKSATSGWPLMIFRFLISLLIAITASGPHWCCCTAIAIGNQWQLIQNLVIGDSPSSQHAVELRDNTSQPTCPRCIVRQQSTQASPKSLDLFGVHDTTANGKLQIRSLESNSLPSDLSECHCHQRSPFVSTTGHSTAEQILLELEIPLNHSDSTALAFITTVPANQWNSTRDRIDASTSRLWGRQILRAYQILRC